MTTYRHLLTILPLLIVVTATAQTPCGIYATKDDFVNNKVTYTFDDCGVKVRLNKDLVAYHQDTKLRFNFNFIYGYADGSDLYRAYGLKSLWRNPGYYRVIYDSDLIIYERIRRDHRSNPQPYYFYSTSKDSPIQPLRKKFYSITAREKIKINLSALRQSLLMPESSGDPQFALVAVAETLVQKKKPDISARLQTTTRRPKIF